MFNARRALISLSFLALPGLAASADPPLQSSLVAVRPRTAAPAMVLKDLDNRTVNLAKLRGKVVAVNFWATWCPPCRREFPSMERLRQKLANKPLVILAVFAVAAGWVGIPEHFPVLGGLLPNWFHEFVGGTLLEHPEINHPSDHTAQKDDVCS